MIIKVKTSKTEHLQSNTEVLLPFIAFIIQIQSSEKDTKAINEIVSTETTHAR
jgi:hypothetical protein